MTWQFDVNNSILGSIDGVGQIFTTFKDFMVAQGVMEVLGSGDGISTYENYGQTAGPTWDILTGGYSTWNSLVANEFSNTEAWMRLRVVDTDLEFIIKRQSSSVSTSEDDIVIAVAPDGFTLGGADANTPPTGTNQQFILGSSFTSYAAFCSYNVNYYLHIGVDDSPSQGEFHPFYVMLTEQSTQITKTVFIFDPVLQIATGDAQPWFIYLKCNSSNPLVNSLLCDDIDGWAYRNFGGGSELWTNCMAYRLVDQDANILFPGGAGIQADDSKTRSCPIIVGNYNYNLYKGVSSFMEWKGVSSRNYPDTVDLTTTDAKCYFDDVIVPWEQNTAPL